MFAFSPLYEELSNSDLSLISAAGKGLLVGSAINAGLGLYNKSKNKIPQADIYFKFARNGGIIGTGLVGGSMAYKHFVKEK